MSHRLIRTASSAVSAGCLGLLVCVAAHRSAEPAVLGRYSWGRAAMLAAIAAAAAGAAVIAFLPSARLGSLTSRIGAAMRHAAPRAAAAAGVLGVFLLIAEGVVRLAGGLGCHPSIDTLVMDIERRPYNLNHAGYRDVEHETAKPAGAFRVVVLGDSFVFGQGVPEPQTWTRRLPASLASRGGRDIEVVNTGRLGLDTVQELGELESYAPARSPDLVIVSFVLNDADWWDPGYYELHRPVPQAVEPLLEWSCLYRWTKRRYNGLLVRTGWARSYVEHQKRVLRGDSAGWARCRAALARIVELSRSRGARTAGMIWPLFTDERPYPLASAHTLVAGAFRDLGCEALDLEPVFEVRPAEGLKVLGEEDPHPGPAACGIAAETLAQFLVERGLVPTKAK